EGDIQTEGGAMRMLGTFCICAIFAASLWAFEVIGWAKKAEDGFAWRGTIEAGKTLLLRNLNGPVVIEAAPGPEAEVTATVAFEKSHPSDLRFEQKNDDYGVQIGAAWPGQTSCFDGNGKVEKNDLPVTFRVKLPRGAALDAGTVNGDLAARGLTGPARLSTVNGAVEAEAAAPLRAETVNGRVDVRLTGHAGDVTCGTVNGDIHVQVPAPIDAEVAARTVTGT